MLKGYGKIELLWIVPEQNRQRYYCLEVLPGLFGPMLARSWGRIGWDKLRMKEHFFAEDDLTEALAAANSLLSAKLRKGYTRV